MVVMCGRYIWCALREAGLRMRDGGGGGWSVTRNG